MLQSVAVGLLHLPIVVVDSAWFRLCFLGALLTIFACAVRNGALAPPLLAVSCLSFFWLCIELLAFFLLLFLAWLRIWTTPTRRRQRIRFCCHADSYFDTCRPLDLSSRSSDHSYSPWLPKGIRPAPRAPSTTGLRRHITDGALRRDTTP